MAITSVLGSQFSGLRKTAQGLTTGNREARSLPSQLFNRYLVIRIDAHSACNLHGFFGNLAGRKLRLLAQSLGGGLRVGAAAANRGNAPVGLDHVSLAAQQECLLFVRNQQQGLEMAQKFVSAPVFCQFHRGSTDVAVILLELRLETAEKGEGIGGRAGKSREDLVLVQPANLLGSVLDDGFAERDLAVSCHDHGAVAADTENRGRAD